MVGDASIGLMGCGLYDEIRGIGMVIEGSLICSRMGI